MNKLSQIKLNLLMENLYLESTVNRIYEEAADFDWIRDIIDYPEYPSEPTSDRKIKIGGGPLGEPRPVWYIKLGDKVKFIPSKNPHKFADYNQYEFIFTAESDDDWGLWGSDMPEEKLYTSDDGISPNHHNKKYLVHPLWSPGTMNESVEESPSGIKKIIQDIINDLGISSKFLTTFGTGITAFYEPVAKLLNGSNVTMSKYEVVLLIITAITFLISDTDFKKLKEVVRERSLGHHLKNVVNFINNSKKLLNVVIKKTANTSYGLTDILGFTFLLVPTMSILSELISDYGVSSENYIQLFTGLAAAAATYGVKSVVDKIKNRF